MTKEQIKKYQERDQNIAKMMTHIDILSKNFMGVGTKTVNGVGVCEVNLDEEQFEVMHYEKVKFEANHRGGHNANYPRPYGNQGWNRDEGLRDSDKDWSDCNATCKERKREKDRYVPPQSVKILRNPRVVVRKTYYHENSTRLNGPTICRKK